MGYVLTNSLKMLKLLLEPIAKVSTTDGSVSTLVPSLLPRTPTSSGDPRLSSGTVPKVCSKCPLSPQDPCQCSMKLLLALPTVVLQSLEEETLSPCLRRFPAPLRSSPTFLLEVVLPLSLSKVNSFLVSWLSQRGTESMI